MPDTSQGIPFTDQQISEQAKANATACAFALLGYALEHGDSPETAARWLGGRLAPSWEEARDQGAYQVAWFVALDMIVFGGTLQDLSGDEQRAHMTVTWRPEADILSMFHVTQDEADAVFTVFAAITEQLQMRYSWKRQGDAVTMTFARECGS